MIRFNLLAHRIRGRCALCKQLKWIMFHAYLTRSPEHRKHLCYCCFRRQDDDLAAALHLDSAV